MNRLLGVSSMALALLCPHAWAQVIEFESNGLKYQTLTRSGVTVIYAHLPNHVHEYSSIQVSVANGSSGPYSIRPEDFSYVRSDGVVLQAAPAREVIAMLMQKGNGGDVVKLITTYKAGNMGTLACDPPTATNRGARRRWR